MRQLLQEDETSLTVGRPREADWANVLEQLPDALIVTDRRGIISRWSGRSEELFGYSSNEAVGRPVSFLVQPDLRRQTEVKLLRAMARGGSFLGEIACIKKNGTHLLIEASVRVLRDCGGCPRGFAGICRDLSERPAFAGEPGGRVESTQSAGRFLDESGAILSGSLDYTTTLQHIARLSVPALADYCIVDAKVHEAERRDGDPSSSGEARPLVGIDPDIRSIEAAVTHSDPKMEPMLFELRRRYPMNEGDVYPAGRVLTTGLSELHPVMTDACLAPMATDPDHANLLRTLAPVSMMFIPLTARGRTIGCLSLARVGQKRPYTRADLSHVEEFAKRAALALDNARLYREAQEANRMRDEFLGTVSHELRTPLNAILGWARMLRSGQLNELSTNRALATIERNAMLQARLIEDLLDASRIVVGKLRMERRVVDLVSAVRAAVDVVRPSAMAKSVQIVTMLDRPPVAVMGDLHRLQQIFWNLLSNAIKFTPNGGLVEVKLERTGTEAKVFVRDTGEGIRASFLPHAFDRFRQGDSTTTRRHGGLGLGLAIVRHLVELHAGSVCADSDGPGQGSTFTVTLPVTPLGDSGVVLVERITPLPGEQDVLLPVAG